MLAVPPVVILRMSCNVIPSSKNIVEPLRPSKCKSNTVSKSLVNACVGTAKVEAYLPSPFEILKSSI